MSPTGPGGARLYLVRHAEPTVRSDVPAAQWHLSPAGRAAAEALAGEPFWASVARVYTSPEPKAVATAQRIAARHGPALRIERDLREMEGRAWVEDGYADLVRRYLEGETVEAWEERSAALERVRACIGRIAAAQGEQDVALVSHGLVLTLYVADLLGLGPDAAYQLWARIRFPDVAILDQEARQVERGFGEQSDLTPPLGASFPPP